MRKRIESISVQRAPVLFMLIIGAGLVLFSYPSRAIDKTAPVSIPADSSKDYAKFTHTSNSHSQLDCGGCHKRVDNTATPRFPGHKSCTACHLAQFITPSAPICGICHTKLSEGNPPLREFRPEFDENFDAKFDHAQHDKGDAKAPNGCNACHTATLRGGVAMTIPAGADTHNTCYTCHTPGRRSAAGRDLGSCSACHSLAPYVRTSTGAVAYNANFGHSSHRFDCSTCHSLRAGLPRSKQVTTPRTAQHFPPAGAFTCRTCHNDRRAFGDANHANCSRCHRGRTFKF